MRKTTKVALGGAMMLALCTAGIAPAFADPNPIGSSATDGDIVGVGSDTLQFVDDFVADGDSQLNTGFNGYHPSQRIDSFDAVNPWTQQSGDLIKLRGSVDPAYTSAGALDPTNSGLIVRPNGSGPGQQTIATSTNCVAGATSNLNVDYSRASSALSTQAKSCLTQSAFATDTIQIAVNNGTAGTLVTGITPLQLKELYEQALPSNPAPGEKLIRTFGDLLGTSAAGANANTRITPVIPQAGSGTYKTFLQGLGFTISSDGTAQNLRTDQVNTVNGANAPIAGELNITEEHNPQIFVTAGQTSSGFANTLLAPFSGGRAALVKAGYFNFLNSTPAAQTAYANSIKLLAGTDSTQNDSAGTYGLVRNLYHDFRIADATKQWAKTFNAFFCSGSATPLISDAGLVQLTGNACGSSS